jgi:hypothetical protein
MASPTHLNMTPVYYKTNVHETMGFNVFNYSNILFMGDAGIFVINNAPGKFTPIPDPVIEATIHKMYMRGNPIDPNNPPKIKEPLEVDVDGNIFFPVSLFIKKTDTSTTPPSPVKKDVKRKANKESKIKKEKV